MNLAETPPTHTQFPRSSLALRFCRRVFTCDRFKISRVFISLHSPRRHHRSIIVMRSDSAINSRNATSSMRSHSHSIARAIGDRVDRASNETSAFANASFHFFAFAFAFVAFAKRSTYLCRGECEGENDDSDVGARLGLGAKRAGVARERHRSMASTHRTWKAYIRRSRSDDE